MSSGKRSSDLGSGFWSLAWSEAGLSEAGLSEAKISEGVKSEGVKSEGTSCRLIRVSVLSPTKPKCRIFFYIISFHYFLHYYIIFENVPFKRGKF